MTDLDAVAEQLTARSYAVLPGLYPADKVARIRGVLARLYERLDAPPMYSKEPRWLADDIEVSGTGLVIHKLLGFDAALHRDVLEADVVAILRRALGPDMYLEFAGAVVVDHTRPFFKWHNHVGGIDDERYRRLGLRPAIETLQRVAVIVYLDPMVPGSGQLLIHPHRVSGAADPPGEVDVERWPGALAVEGPAGTVVMMDQTTWHAALPREPHDELRYFFGLWFASAEAADPEREDETLRSLESPDPLLRSVLPGRSRG